MQNEDTRTATDYTSSMATDKSGDGADCFPDPSAAGRRRAGEGQ